MTLVTIRNATPEDAEEIARLHLHTSLTAYRPLLGEAYKGGDLVERTRNWWRMLMQDLSLPWLPPEKTYVACLEGGAIAGFCAVGASRDDDGEGWGEVQMLYVSPEHWGKGVGKQLFQAGVDYLVSRGFPVLTLWVLNDNAQARGFYDRRGWTPDGSEKPSFSKSELSQVRYRQAMSEPASR